jgi:hypothetical protein
MHIAMLGFAVSAIAADLPAPAVTQSPASETLDQKLARLHELQADVEKSLLAVPPEDMAHHKDFLSNPSTGMIRLLPRGKYETAVTIHDGGSRYSFVLKTHESSNGSDIEFAQGKLRVGVGGADGCLIPLGSLAINQVAALSKAQPPAQIDPQLWQAMWDDFPADNYRALQQVELQLGNVAEQKRLVSSQIPQEQRADASAAFQLQKDALNDQRKALRRAQSDHAKTMADLTSAPAVAGQSYLLRSTTPEQSDCLVGLRIDRQLDDGSLIIVYKVFKQWTAPPQ